MANKKLLGVVLGALSMGAMSLPAYADDAAPADGAAKPVKKSHKSKKSKAADGTAKSCSGDKKAGDAKSCSGDKKAGDAKSCSGDKKAGADKSCGAKGCSGAK